MMKWLVPSVGLLVGSTLASAGPNIGGGVETKGFRPVVQITATSPSYRRMLHCSATWVSPTRLLTAAHCVLFDVPSPLGYAIEVANSVSVDGLHGRSVVSVNPALTYDEKSRLGSGPDMVAAGYHLGPIASMTRKDLAVIEFQEAPAVKGAPPHEYYEIHPTAVQAGAQVIMVGYGFNAPVFKTENLGWLGMRRKLVFGEGTGLGVKRFGTDTLDATSLPFYVTTGFMEPIHHPDMQPTPGENTAIMSGDSGGPLLVKVLAGYDRKGQKIYSYEVIGVTSSSRVRDREQSDSWAESRFASVTDSANFAWLQSVLHAPPAHFEPMPVSWGPGGR